MYSFFLMYILCVPIFLLAEPLLDIWLGQIPDYAVIFLQLIIIQSLFCVFNSSLYTALYTAGRMKENALITPIVGFIRFPVIYTLFKMGFSPVAMSWASLLSYVVLGIIVKPILICKYANYTANEILRMFGRCGKVVVISIIPILIIDIIIKDRFSQIAYFLTTCSVCLLIITLTVVYFGLEKNTRKKMFSIIYKKISK